MFAEKYEFVRSEKWFTFKAALNLMHQRRTPERTPTIVETGTMRMKEDPAGGSSLFFGEYCKRYGGHLTTVDIDAAHMTTSKTLTADYAPWITYAQEDSVGFLGRFDRPIDLIYLDSMDCSPVGDSTPAQEHQVREFQAAKHALGPDSILLLDDANFENEGKPKLLKRVLPNEGWECIADRGQSLWQSKMRGF